MGGEKRSGEERSREDVQKRRGEGKRRRGRGRERKGRREIIVGTWPSLTAYLTNPAR